MRGADDIDWRSDLPLADDLRFAGPPAIAVPRRVLLTGATGFLGAFVLAELLRDDHLEVVCLVRADDEAAGLRRLAAHLEALQLTVDAGRVAVVPGDLARPRLGLEAGAFAALGERVDAVVHAGAEVHFMRPYAALRPANVLGTAEVLRLAGTGPVKPVHHVSTLAVWFDGVAGRRVSEQGDPPAADGLRSGYVRSKWVAERLVRAAAGRGLPAAIHRPGRITGHSVTGATSAWNDLLTALILACVTLGAYPALAFDAAMMPVDHAARTIVRLVRDPRSAGRAFHLFQPAPVPWSALVGMIAAAGHAMIEEPFDAWRARLRRAAADRPALARLWLLLGADSSLLAPRPAHDTPHSRVCLAGAEACPPIDEALVAAYLGFFQRCGRVPPPARPG